ncbi:O-antigen translocase [Coprobacter tertius]|uniref:O-antigen translocase n=1 Tax=Coprobacter tertius TaxID=2944915 RepID=A0ABT1MID2_9BACT|nr:O-antigen translocase [Coprobacter tertius]MCP9611621.1 O-antigen translocase [Coprobacter tertius]
MTGEDQTFVYRRIVKATGLFGGVQFLNIVCSVIKNKVIAVWLGAEGVGIIRLFGMSVDMVTSLTGLGLRSSSVRDISKAEADGNATIISTIITVVRRWSWFAGLLGAVVLLSLAPVLSRMVFHDSSYTWGYVFLSCALLFNALFAGEQAILQGTRQLKVLAKSSVTGTFLSLIISVPLYYFFGIKGIVPSFVLSSLASLVAILFYRRRRFDKEQLTLAQTYLKGKPIAVLGIFMTVSSFITTLFQLIFNSYVTYRSGMAGEGFYQAGLTLVDKYVGLVFIAMSAEYFPRLAAASDNNASMEKSVNQQAEISLLMLIPGICLFIVLQECIIRLLYTADFLVVKDYLLFAAPGILLKAVSWAIGYVFIAKGASKLFLFSELISSVITLACNVFLYSFFNLYGLGFAFLLNFALYLAGIWYLAYRYYSLKLERGVMLYLFGGLASALFISLLLYYSPGLIGYMLTGGFTVVIFFITLKRLLKLIGNKERGKNE